MRRSSSRTRASEDFGEHIPQLRRRVRGEHCQSASSSKPLKGHAPSAPPELQQDELVKLRHVWRRLDVDGDGFLSPDDLFRAVRTHGLRGVSRRDAYEMLWEVSLQPEPGLTFEGFTAAYARARSDSREFEPRRLYNYVVYSLMDTDLNGTVSADEVYSHFYSYVADPGVVAGANWLVESMNPGEEEEVSSGLFVRYMQSGALAAVASGKNIQRPRSAPPSRQLLPPPPRMTATQKFKEATAEMQRQMEHRSYDSMHIGDAANLSSLELRRNRECFARGITNVWGTIKDVKASSKSNESKRKPESPAAQARRSPSTGHSSQPRMRGKLSR